VNQLAWDVTLWMLASPMYLVRWLMRLVRRWRFWRMAYTPAITCGFCGATIWLVGVWRCGCGFQAASHLLRPCPICGRLPRMVRCFACGSTERLPEL
jgi:hypothetical protein